VCPHTENGQPDCAPSLVGACQRLWLLTLDDAYGSSHVLGVSSSLAPPTALTLAVTNNLAVIFAPSRVRYIVSAASDSTVASHAGADRPLRTEPQVCLRCIHKQTTRSSNLMSHSVKLSVNWVRDDTIRHNSPNTPLKLAHNSRHITRPEIRLVARFRELYMKSRLILFRRAGVFYSEDTVTRKQSTPAHEGRSRGDCPAKRQRTNPSGHPS